MLSVERKALSVTPLRPTLYAPRLSLYALRFVYIKISDAQKVYSMTAESIYVPLFCIASYTGCIMAGGHNWTFHTCRVNVD